MIKEFVTSKIKVSIIIPIYNSECYLERCLDSILAQSFTEWECICVNDGSTDRSNLILERYRIKDERFKVIEQENAGASVARNNALSFVKGKYIVFVDSDDYISYDYLQILYEKITNDNSDLCCCGYYSIEREKIVKQHDFPLDNQGRDYFLKCLFSGTGGTICSKIFSSQLIRTNEIKFNTDFSLCEDQLFSLEIMCNSNKITSVEYFGYYYERNNQYSLVKGANYEVWLAQLKLIEYMDSYMLKFSVEDELREFVLENKFKSVLYCIVFSTGLLTYEKWKNVLNNVYVQKHMKKVHIKTKFDFAYIFPIKIKSFLLTKIIFFWRNTCYES